MDPRRATSYQPLTEPVIGIELANVKTPNDAVAFVRRFGLLKESESLGDATSVKYDAQRGELFTDFQGRRYGTALHPYADAGSAPREPRGRGCDKPAT